MIPILNVLWGIVAGERYDYRDPRMLNLTRMLVAVLRQDLAKPDAGWFFPFLAKIFPNMGKKIEGVGGKPGDIKHFLIETIQHHKNTFDENNIRDFIDSYLLEIQVNILYFKIVKYTSKALYCRRERKELASMMNS